MVWYHVEVVDFYVTIVGYSYYTKKDDWRKTSESEVQRHGEVVDAGIFLCYYPTIHQYGRHTELM